MKRYIPVNPSGSLYLNLESGSEEQAWTALTLFTGTSKQFLIDRGFTIQVIEDNRQ